ncbi:hypothetical protein [Armatimonas sp.]|uniref:hypothetical protein n=1 Tax=Armatimonas sp. TaxID=1872638 RepID=UPI00374D48AC
MSQALEDKAMAMTPLSPQPKWSDSEPTKITGVVGGFKDGEGRVHPVPAVLRAYPSVNVVKSLSGEWFWEAIPE